MQVSKIEELNMNEIEQVNGGAVSSCEAAFTISFGVVGASFGTGGGPAGAWAGWGVGSTFGASLAQFACK